MPPSKKPTKPVNDPPMGSQPQEPVDVQKTLSRANRIAVLDIGECVSESIRFDFDQTAKADINNAITVLKGLMSKESSRATARTGNKYTTEVGSFTTRSYDIIVTAVVTRVE